MSQREEAIEAREAAGVLASHHGLTAAAIAISLNNEFEGSYYSAGTTVWLTAEYDHLPPIKIITVG